MTSVLSWVSWISFGIVMACLVAFPFALKYSKRRRREMANDFRPTWNQFDAAHQDALMVALEMALASKWPWRWFPDKLRYSETRKIAEQFVAEMENT